MKPSRRCLRWRNDCRDPILNPHPDTVDLENANHAGSQLSTSFVLNGTFVTNHFFLRLKEVH
jgi:hypothetical protein